MPKDKQAIADKFIELVDIMARLRAPDGCPWDQKQTHASLKKYLIEEAYELLESIDEGDDRAMAEECGDVLLQVVFHAQMAVEEQRFSIYDVLESICGKLIRRHPHVFGDRNADTADEVLLNWDADKQKEKPDRESILDGVPKALPALLRANEIQSKAARVGFDWDHVDEVFAKFEEEWGEFREACQAGDPDRIEDEMGDLFFALVNIARYKKVNPEDALQRTNQKFISRFQYIEKALKAGGQTLQDSTLKEMDALWDEAKALENGRAAKTV